MSTTRETGSIIGNGLKTIISRITTLGAAKDALASVNVSIKDMGGNVKPVSEILSDLAQRWQSLTDEQRQNTGVVLAGRYQLSRFLALMNNWNIATQASTTALNSQGSSMKEQAKYSDSLQARINRLSVAWDKFILSAGKAVVTDGIIDAVGALNSLATVSSKVIDKFGLLPPLFGIIGTAVTLLNAKMKTFGTALIFGTSNMTRMQLASAGLTAGMTRLEIATAGFGVALKGAIASTGIGLLFVGLGMGVEALINHFAKAKKAQEEFEASQQKNIDALTTNKQQTESLIQSYKNLSAQQGSASWDTDKANEYLQIQQKLADTFPSLISYIDSTGQAHLKSGDQIDREIELTNKLIEAKKKEIQVNAQDSIQKELDSQQKLQKEIAKTKQQIADVGKFKPTAASIKAGVADPTNSNDKQIAKLETHLRSLYLQVAESSQKISSKILTISDAFNSIEIDPSIQKGVDDFVNSLDLSKINADKQVEYAKKIAKLKDDMQNAFANGDKDGFDKARDSLIKLFDKMGASDVQLSNFSLSFDDVKKNADNAAKAIYNGTNEVEDLSSAVDDASQSLDQFAQTFKDSMSSVKDLNGVLDDLNKNHKVSADSIGTIMESYPELLAYIDDEGSLREKVSELIQQETKVAKQSILDKLSLNEAFFKTAYADNKEYFSKIGDMYGIDLKNSKSLAEAKLKVEQNLLSTLTKGWSEYYNAQADEFTQQGQDMLAKLMRDGEDPTGNAMRLLKQVTDARQQAAKLANNFDDIAMKSINLDGLDLTSEGLDKVSSSTENSIYISDKYKKALDEVNLAIAKQQALQNKYPDYSSQYQNALKKELTLLNEKKKILEAQAKSLDKQIKSGNIVQYGVQTTSSSTSSGGSYNGKYSSSINKAADRYGVDPNLLAAIIKQESGFNQNARSSAGAIGLMQLMPSTASGLGVNPYNATDNIMGGAKYIAQQLKAFGGDLSKALAAYNAGAGNVRKYGGIPPFAETQNYVKKVLANYNSYSSGTTSTSSSKSSADKQSQVDQAKSDLNQLQQDILDVNGQIQSIKIDIINSQVAAYEKQLNELEAVMSKKPEWSTKYRQDLREQISLLTQETVLLKKIQSEGGDTSSQLLDVQNKIQQARLDIVNSTIDSYEHQKQLLDINIAKAETYANQFTEASVVWRKYEREKVSALDKQKQLQQQEVNYIKDQLENNKLLSTQQRESLRDVIHDKEAELYQIAQTIREANQAIKQSGVTEHIQKANDLVNALKDQVDDLNRTMSMTDNGDVKIELLNKQLDLIKKEREQALANIQDLQKERKVVLDFPDLVKQIDEEIKNWKDNAADLNVEMSNISNSIKDAYNTISDNVIDIYKDMYDKQKTLTLKEIDDELSAYQKMVNEKLKLIDKQDSEDSYNKDLAAKQKELQDLSNQIAKYSMDDSLSGQAKLADLQKQYADKQVDLQDFMAQREKDLRKQNLQDELDSQEEELNAKKDQLSAYYDDLINDEEKWAKIREDIMNGNIDNLTKDLQGFADVVDSNMGDIGKSISQNFIDKVKEAIDLLKSLKTINVKTNNEDFYYKGNKVDTNSSDFSWDDYSKYSEAYVVAKEDAPIFTIVNRKLVPTGKILKKGTKQRAYGRDDGVDAYGLGGNLWVKADGDQVTYERFNTGGFTNNSEGLAFLDKKEIILNKEDTANFLKAIDITRGLKDFINPLFSNFSIPKLPTLAPANTGAPTTIENLIHIKHFNGTKQEVDNLSNKLVGIMTKLGVKTKL